MSSITALSVAHLGTLPYSNEGSHSPADIVVPHPGTFGSPHAITFYDSAATSTPSSHITLLTIPPTPSYSSTPRRFRAFKPAQPEAFLQLRASAPLWALASARFPQVPLETRCESPHPSPAGPSTTISPVPVSRTIPAPSQRPHLKLAPRPFPIPPTPSVEPPRLHLTALRCPLASAPPKSH